MYSCVVHFIILFLFSESKEEKEKAGQGGIVVDLFLKFLLCKVFFYSFLPSSLLNARFRFSSHSSSSHYSMQGFFFISFHPFGGFFVVTINK